MQLIDIRNDLYVTCFSDKEDYDNALENGLWMITNHYLVVQRCKVEFDSFNDQVRKLIIWIRIPSLHLEY